jgi:hypothetical protein
MGRVLVKSALPGKVLVKSNYAFDAFGNPVMLSTPSTEDNSPVRGERLSGILGGAVGAGLSLTQPTNNFGQFINNLRYGMFEGARDARRLRRGLSSRREKIRANRAADIADKYAGYRSQENPAEARKRGMFDRLTGGNFMTAGQQEQELYEANVQRRLADERAARNAALGQEVFDMAGGMLGERPEDLTLQQGQGILGNIRQLGVAGAQRGNRIDVPTVALPPPTEQQRNDLLTELQTATTPKPIGPTIDKFPVGGTMSKPSGKVRVLNAAGNEIAPDANAIAGSQPGVQAAPPQGASLTEQEAVSNIPASNTSVPITKPEEEKPTEEEEVDMSGSVNPNTNPNEKAMIDALTAKFTGAGP